MKTLQDLFSPTAGNLTESELTEMAPSLIGQRHAFAKAVAGARGLDSCEITEAVVTGASITLTLKRPSGHTFQLTPV